MKIGVAGTGGMAARMIRAMQAAGGYEVTAVLSSDPARATAFAGALGAGAGFGEAAAFLGSGVDAVYVATPPGRHLEIAMAALAAGLPVLVEKPMTASLADTEALIDAAGDGLLVEGLWTLTLPAWRAFRAAALDGQAGEPRHFAFDFSYPVEPGVIPSLHAADGGVLRDRAIYGVAAAVDLFGPVARHDAIVTRDGDGVDIRAAITLGHASGQTAQITVALDAGGPNTATLSCAGGVLALGPTSLAAETVTFDAMPTQRARPDPMTSPGLTERLKAMPALRRVKAAISGPKARTHAYGTDQYAPMLAHFRSLVDAGAWQSDLIPHALSREAMRVIEALRTIA